MTAPAGWYDQGGGTQRYWDGAAWTEHIAAAAASPVPVGGQFAPAPIGGPLAQPSGYAAGAPAGAPPVRRKRVWPWVVGIGGGVLLLIIGLVVWGVVTLVGAVTGPIDAVNKFEHAAVSGDCAAMGATVTSSLRDSNGWDECETFKNDAKNFSPSSFNANSSSIVNGVATVTADVRYSGDTTPYVGTYTLIKEDGHWRIDSFSIDASDS